MKNNLRDEIAWWEEQKTNQTLFTSGFLYSFSSSNLSSQALNKPSNVNTSQTQNSYSESPYSQSSSQIKSTPLPSLFQKNSNSTISSQTQYFNNKTTIPQNGHGSSFSSNSNSSIQSKSSMKESLQQTNPFLKTEFESEEYIDIPSQKQESKKPFVNTGVNGTKKRKLFLEDDDDFEDPPLPSYDIEDLGTEEQVNLKSQTTLM